MENDVRRELGLTMLPDMFPKLGGLAMLTSNLRETMDESYQKGNSRFPLLREHWSLGRSGLEKCRKALHNAHHWTGTCNVLGRPDSVRRQE